MSTYIGFSTINANRPRTTNAPAGSSGGTGSMIYPIIPGKKFRMVDAPLVLRDFINALNINKGEKVGQPGYGTDIWSYIFEPNDKITRDEIKQACDSLLLELVGLRAIYDFAVVCDETNNTPTRIDRNELYVDIAIEPVKAVEFIYIPLRVKNTGEI